MKMNTISATNARAKSGKRVGITKKGETKVVLMSTVYD